MCVNGETESPQCNNQRAVENRLVALLIPMLCFLALPGPLRGQQAANPAETTTMAQVQSDPNDPKASHDPGIYYLQQSAASNRMVLLEPAPLGTGLSGSRLKQIASDGLAGGDKWKTSVRGSQARLRITETRPTFYFYLPPNHVGFPGVPNGDSFAMSPREFVLAQLKSRKKERDVPLQKPAKKHSEGLWGGGLGREADVQSHPPSGVRSKDQVPFAYEKVASGIYKIRPQAELKAAEYGFIYAGSLQMPEGRLFDFGIERAK
jgi:hypothetical protein